VQQLQLLVNNQILLPGSKLRVSFRLAMLLGLLGAKEAGQARKDQQSPNQSRMERERNAFLEERY